MQIKYKNKKATFYYVRKIWKIVQIVKNTMFNQNFIVNLDPEWQQTFSEIVRKNA